MKIVRSSLTFSTLTLIAGLLSAQGLALDNSHHSSSDLKSAAEYGEADAQYLLGMSYASGSEGITKDDAQAVKWWLKAAEQGNSKAEYRLGYAYYKGQGVAKNEKEAEKWLRRASEAAQNSGSPDGAGYTWLARGVGVPKDVAAHVNALRIAAGNGDATAQYKLGNAYFNVDDPLNDIGVPSPDTTEAMKWWRKAADQGNAEAQYTLAQAYSRGYSGLSKENESTEVMKWLRAAAEQGYAAAQHSLAIAYANGVGVSKDYIQSYVWQSLAVAQDGRYGTSETIPNMSKSMTPSQIAEAKRLVRERTAHALKTTP